VWCCYYDASCYWAKLWWGEAGDLHEAKQDYKIQLTYQGAYPEEAKELKQEYDDKVAKIKKQYAICHASDKNVSLGLTENADVTSTPLLLLGTAAVSALLGAAVTGVTMRALNKGTRYARLLASVNNF
jgi:hypothetical protein